MFLEYYGFREQPFGVTPDPRFLYMGAAQQEAFASLLYGVETGRGFMALIASPGLGKTTMLLKLMERLQASTRIAFLFQTYSSSEEFLRSLLADLGIDATGHDLAEMQQQLGDALLQEAHSGKRIVVVVDEAQNLDDQVLEMIRMLSNFETPQFKLLQVILVGQPQLADKLAAPQLEQLRQRVSIVTHFPPLRDKDVPRYIEHRLRTAGYEGAPLFTPLALEMIVEQSKGIPRNINNLCFQALSLGYAKNRKTVDEVMMREVIADLSLESLGTSQGAAPKEAATTSEAAIGSLRDRIKAGGTSPSSTFTGTFRPSTREQFSPMDAVNLSSDPSSEDTDADFWAGGRDGRRVLVGQKSHHGIQTVLWVGLAALLAYLWLGPGLRPTLDTLSRFVGGGEVNSKSVERATGAKPAPDVANSPEAQLDSANTPPAPTSKAPSSTPETESPVTADPESGSAPAGENNSVFPKNHPNPLPAASTPPAPRVRAARATNDEGSMAGNCRLIVESSLDSARITINGKSDPKWVTPHLFSLAAGTYLVSVYQGNSQAWTRRIRLDEGREKWLMAELQNNENGVFTVDTDPPGMQVFIDGKEIGKSRVEMTLAPGWHVCTVVPGPGLKPLLRRFHLQPGEALTRRIRLEKPSTSNLEHPVSSESWRTANQAGGSIE
jgi:type II secretory pathway predicted ATPase ExeA